MEKDRNPVAQKLLEAFRQFRRMHWQQSPIVGLKPSEIMVLFCIKRLAEGESSGIKVSEISSALHVSSPTITQLVNSLERNGFVERAVDPEDRRAVRVKLTAKGEGTVGKALDTIFEVYEGLVDYLGEEKSNELAELLSKVAIYFTEKRRDLRQNILNGDEEPDD